MSLPWWSSWSFSIIIYIIIIDLAAELQQWNQHVFLKFMLHSVFIFLSHVLIIIFSTASVLQVPYLMLLWQIWVLSGSNFFITCADNSFTAQKCNGESVIAAEEHRSQVIMTNEDSWRWWSWKARGERPGEKCCLVPEQFPSPEGNEGGTQKGGQISAPVEPGSALCVKSLACITTTYTESLVYIVRHPLRTSQWEHPQLFISM